MSEKQNKNLTNKGQEKTPKPKKEKEKRPESGYPNGKNPSFLKHIIKPGEIRNPKGRTPGKLSLIEKLNRYLKIPANTSSQELKDLCEKLGLPPETDVAQVIMATFIHKTINSQNSGFMTEFMNRMMGKVPEQPQIASEDIVKDVQEAIAQMQGLGAPDPEEGDEAAEETHHND